MCVCMFIIDNINFDTYTKKRVLSGKSDNQIIKKHVLKLLRDSSKYIFQRNLEVSYKSTVT